MSIIEHHGLKARSIIQLFAELHTTRNTGVA